MIPSPPEKARRTSCANPIQCDCRSSTPNLACHLGVHCRIKEGPHRE
jgi:hypothetical protein